MVPNGPSFERDTYLSTPSRGTRPNPYILAVGRIEERKNISMLCKAFSKSNPANVDLVIVGKKDLGYTGDSSGNPRIHFLESISDAKLVELYQHAELFVFPSKAEGFGLPLLDATLFGLPCIASNQTAMPEVADGVAQFFNPTLPNAEADLAGLITEHFGSSPIPRLTAEQRKRQMDRFSWSTSARQFLSILDGNGN